MASSAGEWSGRSYNEYCGMARGLDVIGDRWTLLLVRDLLLGPKRYKDLLAGLPGIGTNLLADRLRELEEVGVIERTVLPPPAGSSVYQLTETGQALEPALHAIGRWGSRFLGAPRKADMMVPRSYFLAMRATFQPDSAPGLNETYEVRVDDLAFEVRIQNGRCTTREGLAHDPDAVLTMDVETLNALMFHLVTPAAALAAGRVQVKGDPKALERFTGAFGFHRRPGMVDTHASRAPSRGKLRVGASS